MESLESRQLSAVDVSLTPEGVLMIQGDSEHNYIDLSESAGEYSLYTLRNRLDAQPDQPKIYTFDQAMIKSVVVNAGAGDDLVNNRTSAHFIVFGGDGVDNLWGGTGINELYDTAADTVFINQGTVTPGGIQGTLRDPRGPSPIAIYYNSLGGVTGELGLPTNEGEEFVTPLGTRYRTYEHGVIVQSGDNVAHVSGEFLKKWQTLGGVDNATLGNPQDTVLNAEGFRFQRFTHGAIFDRGARGTFEVHGAIYQHWVNLYLGLNGSKSSVGLPRSDEMDTPDGKGRQSLFDGGRIVWTRATGSLVFVHAPKIQLIKPSVALNDKLMFMTSVAPIKVAGQSLSTQSDALYTQLGRERGALGPIVSGERLIGSKMMFVAQFKNGAIYRTPTSTVAVYGDIYKKYISSGGFNGFLGLPLNSESATDDRTGARFNRFENGAIYWKPTTGAFEIHGSIYQRWLSLGGIRSQFGYPISDELTVGPDGDFQVSKFQFGALSYSTSTGVLAITGNIWKQWNSLGAERSSLGAPTFSESLNSTTQRITQEFAGGTLSVSTSARNLSPITDFRFDQMKWGLRNLASIPESVSAQRVTQVRNLLSSTNTMPEHVRNLLNKLTFGDLANTFYRGRFLGSFGVGMTQQNFQNIVEKWFGGGERPRAIDGNLNSYVYAEATGPLFKSSGFGITDINQGVAGDCYFLATLASLAIRSPDVIRNMFIDNGDGTFTVRFYNEGKPEYVSVDRYLPTRDGKLVYASEGESLNTQAGLWVALAEKAWAIASASGWTGQSKVGDYGHGEEDGIQAGSIKSTLAMVANINATNFYPQVIVNGNNGNESLDTPVIPNYLTIAKSEFLNSRNWGTLISTPEILPATSRLAGDHAYVVLNATADGGITLFNPWGFDTATEPIITVSWAEAEGVFNCWTRY